MAKAPTSALGLPKIGTALPPRTISLAIEAALAAELDRYAEAYAASYGETVDLETLIPHMLDNYIAADRGFKKWKNSSRVSSAKD